MWACFGSQDVLSTTQKKLGAMHPLRLLACLGWLLFRPPSPPRLLRSRDASLARPAYSRRTEEATVWIRRFILSHASDHPEGVQRRWPSYLLDGALHGRSRATLYLGAKYASNWAAIAAIAPAAFALVPNAVPMLTPIKDTMPVIVTQGDADTAVPVEYTRRWTSLSSQRTSIRRPHRPDVISCWRRPGR
jgi:hypothetical protein